jgi:hypothetical protein
MLTTRTVPSSCNFLSCGETKMILSGPIYSLNSLLYLVVLSFNLSPCIYRGTNVLLALEFLDKHEEALKQLHAWPWLGAGLTCRRFFSSLLQKKLSPTPAFSSSPSSICYQISTSVIFSSMQHSRRWLVWRALAVCWHEEPSSTGKAGATTVGLEAIGGGGSV